MKRERQLIKQAKNGDLSALDEIVRYYYPEIYKYCCWHTKTVEEAEDATQETFFKSLRFMNAYKNNGTFRAFLYKIALNTCIDISRKKNGNTNEYPNEDISEIEYEEVGYENIESDFDFEILLHDLTGKQKELIILRFAHNLSFREIAEITDSNLRTTQANIRKALKKIEKQLNDGKGM